MPNPIADDPRLAKILEADAALTAPGAPFEIVEEDVLGERLPVFAQPAPHPARAAPVRRRDRSATATCTCGPTGAATTFTGLVAEVAEVAAGLRDRYGVGKGDRVAVCAANCPEWILTFWACAVLDAVLVAMNGWWTGAEMRNAIDLTKPTVLVMDEKRHARLEGADPGVPTVVIERDWASVPVAGRDRAARRRHRRGRPVRAASSPAAPPAVRRPRCSRTAAILSYLQMQAYTAARAGYLAGVQAGGGQTVPPTRLATYPLFHVSGLSNIVGCVATGAKSVWPLGRFEPGVVIELTKREGINTWGGGTAHVMRLLDHPDVDTVDPKQLLSIDVGGSATPPAVIDRIEEMFPHLTGTTLEWLRLDRDRTAHACATNWMLRMAPDDGRPAVPDRVDPHHRRPSANRAARRRDRGTSRRAAGRSMIGYWDNPGPTPRRSGRAAGSAPATTDASRTACCSSRRACVTSSSAAARTSTRSRSRTASTSTPR